MFISHLDNVIFDGDFPGIHDFAYEYGPEEELYFYHSDHLGSSTFITDAAGEPYQFLQYLPFGEPFVSQHVNMDGWATLYTFSAKEQDAETGYHYFGARYYDSELSVWLSVDPMSDRRPGLSAYNYTKWSPLNRVDPTGLLCDDYFNKRGEYLGSDEAKTDNVKIIDQKDWDENKIINSDGSESIAHIVGRSISTDHSKSDLTKDATLNVYNQYNPTDLKLKAKQNETGAGGLTFRAQRKSGETSEWIEVKIQGNKRTRVSDHAKEIINIFAHEEQHYNDYKKLGIEGYIAVPKNKREQRAVSAQMKHESFKGTRFYFQRSVKNYGREHGMIFPIKPKPAVLISISQ